MTRKTLLYSLAFVPLLHACASPTVVDERMAGDESLDCQGLLAAIDEANRFEREARDERGVTGTNVAAAVFFWPAMLGTYKNTEDAIEAAKDRGRYLLGIYDRKGCSMSQAATAPGGDELAAKLAELSSLLEAGAISEEEYQALRRRALNL